MRGCILYIYSIVVRYSGTPRRGCLPNEDNSSSLMNRDTPANFKLATFTPLKGRHSGC